MHRLACQSPRTKVDIFKLGGLKNIFKFGGQNKIDSNLRNQRSI